MRGGGGAVSRRADVLIRGDGDVSRRRPDAEPHREAGLEGKGQCILVYEDNPVLIRGGVVSRRRHDAAGEERFEGKGREECECECE